jgi:hypothetical protein
MDGPTATRAIRALGYTGRVLGVTGNGQEFDVLKLLDSGADRVFTKPLDMVGFTEFMRQADAPPPLSLSARPMSGPFLFGEEAAQVLAAPSLGT